LSSAAPSDTADARTTSAFASSNVNLSNSANLSPESTSASSNITVLIGAVVGGVLVFAGALGFCVYVKCGKKVSVQDSKNAAVAAEMVSVPGGFDSQDVRNDYEV
jgi:hypothetical protein